MPVTVVDAFNREGLRTYLSAHGFEIVEAADEASALARSREAPLSAAVVDISIPPDARRRVQPNDVCGLSVAALIKKEQPDAGVEIFSAYEDRGDDVMRLVRNGNRGVAYKLMGCAPERPQQAAAAGHLGLLSMQARIASVGGDLSIDSGAQTGVAITCWVPERAQHQ